jgi:hypothetical protein
MNKKSERVVSYSLTPINMILSIFRENCIVSIDCMGLTHSKLLNVDWIQKNKVGEVHNKDTQICGTKIVLTWLRPVEIVGLNSCLAEPSDFFNFPWFKKICKLWGLCVVRLSVSVTLCDAATNFVAIYSGGSFIFSTSLTNRGHIVMELKSYADSKIPLLCFRCQHIILWKLFTSWKEMILFHLYVCSLMKCRAFNSLGHHSIFSTRSYWSAGSNAKSSMLNQLTYHRNSRSSRKECDEFASRF